jgi:DNA-binding PadR family transcriptional regulator
MSSIRLLVLGVVRIFQPIHGYDVRRELISWRAEEWGNIAPGSIYNAVKTLTREGFLAISGTGQVGARPERTSYLLTPAGEEEHMRLLREAWREVRMPIDPLMPALAFMTMLPRAELIGYLRERMARIERQLEEVRWAQEHLVATAEQTAAYTSSKREMPRKPDGRLQLDDDFKPEHVYETFELLKARVGSELEWSRSFIARLEAGRYQLAGEPGETPKAAKVQKVQKVQRRATEKSPVARAPERSSRKPATRERPRPR